jgi:hypothetical protein
MNQIIESLMPTKSGIFTFLTIEERLLINDYIRQLLLEVSDGEHIGFNTHSGRNIMSYIKLMQLAPTDTSIINNNPYRGMPYHMLVYLACWPIKYNPRNNGTLCGKNSSQISMRFYCLTIAEYYSYTLKQPVYKKYDVWRELIYYEYIRENILRKKECPHFIMMHLYYLSNSKSVNYFNLKKKFLTQKDLNTNEYKAFKDLYKRTDPNTFVRLQVNPNFTLDDLLPDEKDPMLQKYSEYTMLMITEAPHHNLYQWSSRKYEVDGPVSKMISVGYHTSDIWYNILFQLIVSFYVMSKHKIYIKDMKLNANVFIRDVATYEKSNGYWKYVIQGLTYYLPNKGYVLLIDSSYRDIIPESTNLDNNRQYKVYISDILPQPQPVMNLEEKIYENYRRMVNTNNFTKEKLREDIFRPPPDIIAFIEKLMTDPEKDFGLILRKYFRRFMNNRIGTLLKENEVALKRELNDTVIKPGDMMILIEANNLYRWIMIDKVNENDVEIYKDSSELTVSVNRTNLAQYSPTEKIEQNSADDVSFIEEKMLETYIIN